MKSIVLAVAIIAGASSSAWAEGENLCHHAGLTYSPGAMARMGQALVVCTMSESSVPTWAIIDETSNTSASANCVSGGREFGQGTLTASGATELVCRNGIWFKTN